MWMEAARAQEQAAWAQEQEAPTEAAWAQEQARGCTTSTLCSLH